MSKPVLFVCKSCNAVSNPDLEPSLGTCLLNRLQELNQDRFEIRAEECMWMCEQACVAAISASDRHTYLFTDLPLQDSAEALLEFAELYYERQGKLIPFKIIPQGLQSVTIARISPV
jgi:predicted metal-binding protein